MLLVWIFSFVVTGGGGRGVVRPTRTPPPPQMTGLMGMCWRSIDILCSIIQRGRLGGYFLQTQTLKQCWVNAGPYIRRWPNFTPALSQHLKFAGFERVRSRSWFWHMHVWSWQKTTWSHNFIEKYFVVQSQKAVTAYFTSEHLLPFGFAEKYCYLWRTF